MNDVSPWRGSTRGPGRQPLEPDSATGVAGGIYAHEAEREIPAAIMLAGDVELSAGHRALARARAVGVEPAHFYSRTLGLLYAVIIELADAGQPVDPLAIAHELERRALANVPTGLVAIDWPTMHGRLVELAHEVCAVGVLEHRARLVVDAAARRDLEEHGA
jgi:hypothetical protein